MAYTYAGQFGPEVLVGVGAGSAAVVLSGLQVYIYLTDGVTPATLYTDRSKGSTVTQPITTDSKGDLTFFADPGRYVVSFTPAGSTNQRITVAVQPDTLEPHTSPLGSGDYVPISGHLTNSGTAPTAAAGANAGTSPPVPVVAAGSSDTRGKVTFGTGTSPAAGTFVNVTFATPYAAAPYVVLEPINSATAGLGQLYVTNVTTTGFSIAGPNAPAASQANTVYGVHYHVVG